MDVDKAREVNVGCLSAVFAQNVLWALGCDRSEGKEIWLTRRTDDVVATPPVPETPTATVDHLSEIPTVEPTKVVPTATPFPEPLPATSGSRVNIVLI